MKIEYIKLINFQAHSQRLIKLSPTITTIKGSTDKGKSAILRALSWVCLNNIPGDEFVKQGTKKATVAVKLDDDGVGTVIERHRSVGGAINTYEVGGDELKAFGQGVPTEVSSLLGLAPINFQMQHDAPFWFTETAGEVSRQLNAIIDLSVIDSSLSYAASLVRENQVKERLCQERLNKVKDQLNEVGPLRERIKEFAELEKLKEEADERQANSDRLEGLLSTIRSLAVKKKRERAEEILSVWAQAKEARALVEQSVSLSNHIDELQRLSSLATTIPDFTLVQKAHDEWESLVNEAAFLEGQIKDARRAEETYADALTNVADKELEFQEKTRGLICPLCGNEIE